MNESFVIQFFSGGKSLNLKWVNAFGKYYGAVEGNQFSSWPQPMRLEFGSDAPGTQAQMEKVRNRHGLSGTDRYPLKFKAQDNGDMRFMGKEAKDLPAGIYWIRVRLKGYKTSEQVKFSVPEEGSVDVKVDLEGDPRTVKTTRAVDDFDAKIRTVVDREGGALDKKSVRKWIEDETRTPARRACLLNLLAKLRTVPEEGNCLADHCGGIFLADIDRIYAIVTKDFHSLLDSRYSKDRSIHPTHFRLVERAKRLGAKPELYDLASYREPAMPSLQCVVAIPKDENAGLPYLADVDIDEANPFANIKGFFVHIGELLDGHPTDHLDMRKRLIDQAAGNFIYYDVENPA